MNDKFYISICLITKNSNHCILEWLKYHLHIGIEHFYIYDDNSEVPLNIILKEYIDNNIVTYININDIQLFDKRYKQIAAYYDCLRKFKDVNKWIAFIDDDEFIFPKKNNNIKEFLVDYENYSGVVINWVMFGSSGYVNIQNNVLNSYIYRLPYNISDNNHIKSIVNTEFVDINNKSNTSHNFYYKKGHYPVNEMFKNANHTYLFKFSNEKIQINHYWCKSENDFKLKISKGSVIPNKKFTMNDFTNFNKQATIFDNEIIKYYSNNP